VKDPILFTLSIQAESKRLIKGLQLLLLAVNALFLLYLLLTADQFSKIVQLIAPFLLLVVFPFIWERKNQTPIDKLSRLLMILGLSFAANWLANYYWLPGIGMIGLTYLFVQAIRPITILFSTTNIKFNTFPAYTYSWKELEQVVLRDTILTLNFCDNRFIQHPVDLPDNFNTAEFNQFCFSRFGQVKYR